MGDYTLSHLRELEAEAINKIYNQIESKLK